MRRSGNGRALYTVLLALVLPLALLRLVWRSRRDAGYRRRIAERLGCYRCAAVGASIWVHAVSVGEVLTAVPLIEALARAHPRLPILVTTTTPGGSQMVRERLGARVLHVYAPWDLPCIVTRFLARFRPRVAIMIETELWPNQAGACAARAIPLLVVNARLSVRSAARYARFGTSTRAMLKDIRAVMAQTDQDAQRFVALGMARERLWVCGSLKWEWQPDVHARQQARELRRLWGGCEARAIWIAVSTHPGEESVLLDALRHLHAVRSSILLVLAPRHPERAPELLRLVRKRGFTGALRSRIDAPPDTIQVLVIDTLGELAMLQGVADVVFVGGSLVARGAHNFAEAAAWGCALLSGESVFNFNDAANQLTAAGALHRVSDARSLALAVEALLADPGRRKSAGAAALGVSDSNRGALRCIVSITGRMLAEGALQQSASADS